MKYKDLIQFDPIETVITLTEADNEKKAADLVKTFVISQSMEINLNNIIIPNLQFDIPSDQKGIFIVGNYGTGKSHLMAFISALAENSDYLDLVNNSIVKEQAKQIAGKFKVIRSELGGVSTTLRNAICMELEKHLCKLGINFTFPSIDKIANNKDSIHEMMALFQEKYPDQGLVLILDELLDFLRGREDDQKLLQDLGFLREIGEVCKNSRFRFITGVQESLFESPSFKFAADSLGRVSERYIQATIQKEDVSYVVSERLLKKTPKQKAKIREHLEKFQLFYKPLSGGLENYVDLFPVHEQYFEKFQLVNIGEQRKILESISKKIQSIIDLEVPEKGTGIFSYDSYWKIIVDDHTNRANPDVKKVIEISERVETILNESYEGSKEQLQVAHKIVSALAIHRLTTGDLKAAVGLTAENLKDELFLYLTVPEKDENFLLIIIQKVIKNIMTTLNSLYIRLNEENRHYYIYTDMGKDPNQEIRNKASKLSADKELTRYYFEILSLIMEQTDVTYRTGFKIWEYQLMWHQKKSEIDGYLFFGSPNERSTTQPPREFYIYFIDPFRQSSTISSGKEDEVFFQLKDVDDIFEENLRHYAAAKELSLTAVQDYKTVYNQLAQKYQRELLNWLKDNISDRFQVSYKNSTKLFTTWSASINLRELSGISSSERLTFKQQIDTLSSGLLSDYITEQKPDYPEFSIKITNQNRKQTVQEALKAVVRGQINGQANAVLTALDLLSAEGISVDHSVICSNILTIINSKETNQVVNRNELVIKRNDKEFIVNSSLEIDFLPVYLSALISEGFINLSIGSERFTASNLDALLSIGFNQIIDFNHIKKAEDFPLVELKALFTVLKLRPGLIVQSSTRKEAIKELIDRADALLNECAESERKIRNGFILWEQKLLSEGRAQEYIDSLVDVKGFIETISRYNTPAKIINFKKTLEEIESFKTKLGLLSEIEGMVRFVQEFQPLANYLARAESEIPDETAWEEDYNNLRSHFINSLATAEPWKSADTQSDLKSQMQKLKNRYMNDYIEIHKHFRLGPKAHEYKGSLQRDSRLECLRALSTIEILPFHQLRNWEETLVSLKNCTLLTMSDLENSPKCLHCGFERKGVGRTSLSADQRLQELDSELDELYSNWKITLKEEMEDPTIQANLDLLGDKESVSVIKFFISDGNLPDTISSSLVQAIKDVLKGLDKVSINQKEFIEALNKTGLPISPNELRERFETYLSNMIAGREEKQIRIVIEE
ncbi:MAG: hypothetical protein B6241_08630 [Spirochaetaceae bacterium 4572_59]|nr:MAG: hypothetical protein B6241_08630 [Spirochaetaceae bacterium 4572_59]